MLKTLIILANSFRAKHRCIAGKELLPQGGKYQIGDWIRLAHPDTETGAVPVESTRFEDGSVASVLDIVQVQVENRGTDPNHPEDWFIEPASRWRKVRTVTSQALPRLADNPGHLWKEGYDARSVPAGFVAAMPQPASIYLIKAPAGWRVDFWKERTPYPETAGCLVEKTRRRMNFRYGDQFHELDVTDPLFLERYKLFENARMEEYQRVPVERPDSTYLCLSLTPDWNGRQYKVAATILDTHA